MDKDKPIEGMLPIRGIKVYYISVGKGEPLVILHGGPGFSSHYLFLHFHHLSDRYQIIFYDQRSSGRSSGHENPLEISIQGFVDDLEEIRKTLNIEKMNLLGHSWGSLVAMNYTITYPENINHLVLIGSMGASSSFLQPFKTTIEKRLSGEEKKKLVYLASQLGRKDQRSKPFKEYFAIYLSTYFFDKRKMKQLKLGYFDDEMVMKYLICNACLSDYQKQYNLFGKLGTFPVPTLIIHGKYDPIPYQAAMKIHREIKNSKFLLLKNSGHFPFIEEPEICYNTICKFLNQS